MSQFKAARVLVRTSLRLFRKQKEENLIKQKNSRNLYAYINCHLKNKSAAEIKLHDGSLSDSATANAFSNIFCRNFGRATDVGAQFNSGASPSGNTLENFSCDMSTLKKLIFCSRNSAAGPDGFSMGIIQQIFHCISYSLLIVYQQSLFQGIFPAVWKTAHIVPI
jgi:hypothetical protein